MSERLHSSLTGPRQKSEMRTRADERLERDAEAAKREREWNREIDQRDGKTCRACGKRTDPDAVGLLRGHRHHIVYRSAGGGMESANRITLCPKDHQAEHKDQLRFTAEGGPYVGIDANVAMEFWRKDDAGRFYLSVREIAVGVAERD